MARAWRRSAVLAAAAVCALAASAIAWAAPASHASRHTAVRHARRCAAPSRAHRRARRSSRCRRRRSQHRGGASAPAASGAPATGGSTAPPAGGPPATAGGSSAPAQPAPAPGETPATPPPSVPHVQVTAVEYSYTLSRTTVPAGKVVIQFVNNGQDEHNLNVLPAEGPPAGSFADTPSKGIGDLAITLRPGTYTLFCSLPEHEAKGMKATLLVQ